MKVFHNSQVTTSNTHLTRLHTQCRAKYFTTRFAQPCVPPPPNFLRSTTKPPLTPPHTSANHPLLTVSESLEKHLLAVGSVASHSAGPHLDHIASPRPETLKNHIRYIALDHWTVQHWRLELQRNKEILFHKRLNVSTDSVSIQHELTHSTFLKQHDDMPCGRLQI